MPAQQMHTADLVAIMAAIVWGSERLSGIDDARVTEAVKIADKILQQATTVKHPRLPLAPASYAIGSANAGMPVRSSGASAPRAVHIRTPARPNWSRAHGATTRCQADRRRRAPWRCYLVCQAMPRASFSTHAFQELATSPSCW